MVLKPFDQSHLLTSHIRSTTVQFNAPGHDSHELLAQFLALSSQAFVIGFPDGSLGMMNSAFERLTGYSAEELQGISWETTLTPPEWRETDVQMLTTIDKTGIPARYEKELIRKDGARIPVELHVHKGPEPTGEPYYFAFVADISERKQIEQDRLASEQRFREVLETSVNCLYRYNLLEHRYDYMSPASLRILGYTPEELIDLRITNAYSLAHPDDRDLVKQTIENLAEIGETEIEYRFKVKDGEYRWIANRMALGFDTEGNAIYRRGALRDCTDRKLIEQQLKESERRQQKIAETVQRSLLLAPEPNAYPGLVAQPFYQSADDDALVGGDFYDIYPLGEDRILLVVGDATGKGISAATYTAEVKFALRAYALAHPNDISTAVQMLNEFICQNIEHDATHKINAFVALVAAVLNVQTGELACVCAGSEPPLLLNAHTAEITRACEFGALLGVDRDSIYSASRFQMSLGDSITLTTDGITEAHRRIPDDDGNRGTDTGFFGIEGLATILKESHPLLPSSIDHVHRRIVSSALEQAGGNQPDDICLLTVKYVG